MRLILIFILLSFVSCKFQSYEYKIDKSVEKELELNKNSDEMSKIIEGGNAYFGFYSKEMEKMFKEKDRIGTFETMFSSDEKLLRNVCGCQLKNDTIIMTGGIFYGGGIGYQITINKKTFDGQILLGSNSKKYKKEKNVEYTDELILESVKQELYLSKEPKFELDYIIKGKILMESEALLKKSENGLMEDKYWMKIVFECKLRKHPPF